MPVINLFSADSTDHKPFATFYIDTLPRVGEKLTIKSPYDDDNFKLPYSVLYVSHRVELSSHDAVGGLNYYKAVQEIDVVVTQFREPAHHVYIEWVNEQECPEWLDENTLLLCDIVPRTGDIVELYITRPDDTNETGLSHGETIICEVVSVGHSAEFQILTPDFIPVSQGVETGIVLARAEGREASMSVRALYKKN